MNVPVKEIQLGPGSYDPKFQLTKPRVKVSKFREETNRHNEKTTLEESIEK